MNISPLMQSQIFIQVSIHKIKNFSFKICTSQINILILTEEFAVDVAVFLRWGELDRPFFVTSNRCIQLKNMIGSSAAVFCTHAMHASCILLSRGQYFNVVYTNVSVR
jgi:hypothetical protein